MARALNCRADVALTPTRSSAHFFVQQVRKSELHFGHFPDDKCALMLGNTDSAVFIRAIRERIKRRMLR
ncbi:hypothetical protein DBY65_024920 [Pseudomonas sp. RIT412]|nr:hypothetical protein DBP26_024285 [Pseudomonas sp. RIT 409]RAU47790.1 hypothetical protein DBY65_024920 [Pseudomonas sp. RIT 412]